MHTKQWEERLALSRHGIVIEGVNASWFVVGKRWAANVVISSDLICPSESVVFHLSVWYLIWRLSFLMYWQNYEMDFSTSYTSSHQFRPCFHGMNVFSDIHFLLIEEFHKLVNCMLNVSWQDMILFTAYWF